MQSATVKTDVSAIKRLLIDDGYDWDDQKILLGSLTSACKLINDKVHLRLPIQCNLLEMILFEVQRIFNAKGQWYLEILYKALFSLSYYGMMRVSEVTLSEHVLKAKDIHEARNKDKLLVMLYTSKTHTTANRPQKLKITSNSTEKSGCYAKKNFCPFKLVKHFIDTRTDYNSDTDQFFIFSDGSPVRANNARQTLNTCLINLGLDPHCYGMHSFRVGRTTDLIKFN